METFTKLVIVLVVAAVALPSLASGDIRQFIPRIFDYAGELEVNMSYDSYSSTSNGRGLKTTDIFARERLTLLVDGYIYHPRFILFVLKGSGGLKEEDFKTNSLDSGWSTATSKEYELRAYILPEHPYKLEVFTLRLEPLSRQQFSAVSPVVSYSSGAIFRYKRKPYFVTASFTDSTSESQDTTSNSKIYTFGGTYYKTFGPEKSISFTTSYDHTDSKSSSSLSKTSGNNASFENSILFRSISLGSGVSYTDFDESGEGPSLHSDSLSWSEGLFIRLPWHFNAALSYGLSKTRLTIGETASSPEIKTSTKRNNASFSLTHQLYQSLTSSYLLDYSSLTSSGGENKVIANFLSVNYQKKIPWGRLATGVGAGRSDNENTGAPVIVNESHPSIPVPGFFILNNPDVDGTTIIVFLKSPGQPFELIPLTENVHYIKRQLGNMIEIDIDNLPANPSGAPFPIPGTYDFLVTYSLIESSFKLRSDSLGYNVSLSLFDNLLNPYYRYYRTTQKLLSGAAPIEPIDQTTNTAGIIIQKLPFTLLGEYQVITSNINPSKSWRAELSYAKSIADNTQLSAKASYSSTRYSQNTSLFPSNVRTDTAASVGVNLQRQFPKKNLYLNFGSSYSQRKSVSTSKVYLLNANLVWVRGQIAINLGASASVADTEFPDRRSKRIAQYYYLNLKRRLF